MCEYYEEVSGILIILVAVIIVVIYVERGLKYMLHEYNVIAVIPIALLIYGSWLYFHFNCVQLILFTIIVLVLLLLGPVILINRFASKYMSKSK